MITEEQARKILAEAGSPAASQDEYEAHRLEGGWAFRWFEQTNEVRFGGRTWVVTDSGKADMIELGEKPEQAIARLSEDKED